MRDIVEVFPVPERPTNAIFSPALIARLRFVNTGALGRDPYAKKTFWNVMLPVRAWLIFRSEFVDWGGVVLAVVSIVGFWSCRAKTREAAPFARPMSGARLNI